MEKNKNNINKITTKWLKQSKIKIEKEECWYRQHKTTYRQHNISTGTDNIKLLVSKIVSKY